MYQILTIQNLLHVHILHMVCHFLKQKQCTDLASSSKFQVFNCMYDKTEKMKWKIIAKVCKVFSSHSNSNTKLISRAWRHMGCHLVTSSFSKGALSCYHLILLWQSACSKQTWISITESHCIMFLFLFFIRWKTVGLKQYSYFFEMYSKMSLSIHRDDFVRW